MSLKISCAVWDSFEGSHTELLVMLAMADWANDLDGTGTTKPSLPKIAKKTRLSTRTVTVTVANLIKAGWIAIAADENTRWPGSAREYQIALDRLTIEPLQFLHGGDEGIAGGGVKELHGGDEAAAPPDQDGKYDRKKNTTLRFAEFWQLWPNTQRKTNRKGCLQRWHAGNLDACADDILRHVASLKTSTQWLGGYEPAPMTYLNQRRWEDGVVLDVPSRKVAL